MSSRILLDSLPAERKRGMVFTEQFRNTAEVAENGGTIVGSVASYPKIPKVKTVIAKLKHLDSSSQTVKINASQTITITAGNLFSSYNNATVFDADDIQVDDWEKFKNVSIFKKQLSAEEILAYSNNTMFEYSKNCVLTLPMLLRDHDPTAGVTKDRSGEGNDATITGATKLSRRGYSFDGVNDLISLISQTSKFPYMLIKKTGEQISFSELSADYTAIGTAGSFPGEVYQIRLFDVELNETQKADLHIEMMNGLREEG